MKDIEEKWKGLVAHCKGSVYQTYAWAELKEKTGRKPVFITLEEDGTLLAGILAFEEKIILPVIGEKKILVAEGTPLFRTSRDGERILDKFKEESRGYFYGLISPTVINPQCDLFKKKNYYQINNHTTLIDLTKDEPALLNNLKRDVRKRLKKYAERGIIVRDAKKEELAEFYKIYSKTLEEGGAQKENILFFTNLNLLIERGLARVILAERESKILSGILVLYCSDYSIYSASGSSEEGHQYQANIPLLWEAILSSKKANKKYFDMGGYDKEAKPEDKTWAINNFKERFGGVLAEQPFFSTNKKYFLLRKLLKKAKFLKKYYKKQK